MCSFYATLYGDVNVPYAVILLLLFKFLCFRVVLILPLFFIVSTSASEMA